MKHVTQKQVVIVGSGNVAWHLAWVLTSLNLFRVSVYNHKVSKHLKRFKSELGSQTGVGLETIPGDADYYFICVSDRAVPIVAAQLNIRNPKAVLMHTSGSVELSDLGDGVYNRAAFYPLQSFSAQTEAEWSDIPILIEAQTPECYRELKALADKISNTVVRVTYSERLKMHLAAVLVNNFTNALYVAAADLVRENDSKLSFDLLQPIIQQTTHKVLLMDPRQAQTGPAKRGDKAVMKKHLTFLEDKAELKKLYKLLSKLIKKQQRVYA